jgi:hypothetical protein
MTYNQIGGLWLASDGTLWTDSPEAKKAAEAKSAAEEASRIGAMYAWRLEKDAAYYARVAAASPRLIPAHGCVQHLPARIVVTDLGGGRSSQRPVRDGEYTPMVPRGVLYLSGGES